MSSIRPPSKVLESNKAIREGELDAVGMMAEDERKAAVLVKELNWHGDLGSFRQRWKRHSGSNCEEPYDRKMVMMIVISGKH
jgi:hypothetical protein